MNTIRTFIAVESSPEVREAAGRLVQQWERLSRDVKWVEPENMHLTLKFLGDVDSEQIPSVTEAVRKAAAECRPFELEIRGTGAFPSLRRPNVFWLGVGQGAELLGILAQKVERTLEPLGFRPEDRPFHGHLTLGRVRRGGGQLAALLERLRKEQDFQAGWVSVRQITLFSSQLTPQGPIYTPLDHAPLAGDS
ncbi:MAG TPA: RNA 2',3'-cyclic phosphodiesterase [Thermoguttaceae bacterium]|mgnify:CR=1 FL=1|nr:RNA 2',3'-cyclic phosphodiesterase [Thermoguttaceae bacterium]